MTATAHVKTFLSCGHGLQNASSPVETNGSNSGFFESIRHTKVGLLCLKSCFLRKKETTLDANLWKTFSTELFSRRSWWFHVVLLDDLHVSRKPRPRSSSARPVMPFVNQERLVLISSLLSCGQRRLGFALGLLRVLEFPTLFLWAQPWYNNNMDKKTLGRQRPSV